MFEAEKIDKENVLSWDIFCRVIDNFGDIGVSWRLARQLRLDYQQAVRLWVDDLKSLACIAPQIKPDLTRQFLHGVEICHWQQPFPAAVPADVVIEMFACDLPDIFVTAMVQSEHPPIWINLEYLSAERWVPEYHGLCSPHPRHHLNKTFFFPGFVPGTGGLLREKDLLEQRQAFDKNAEWQFWQSIGLPERSAGEYRVSLFCYEHAPLAELIDIWIQSPVSVVLIIPQGVVADQVVRIMNTRSKRDSSVIKSGQLSVQIIPFLEQSRYDRLLWACDLNFVRGEDSFVRAQWAGKPLVWHIYPQSDNIHWKKLDAFLDCYTDQAVSQIPEETADVIHKLWYGWNAMSAIDSTDWLAFVDCFHAIALHSMDWMRQLALQNDLTCNLVKYVRNQL